MRNRLEQVASQNVKQIQRLILSPQMQQALHLLQLPVLELSTMVEEELTQNPLLEFESGEIPEFDVLRQIDPYPSSQSRGDDLKGFIENTLSYESSLFESLMQQAKEVFVSSREVELAEVIIGNLDHDGLLSAPLEEIAALSNVSVETLQQILEKIQQFEPLGVGAKNLRESLLIQLKGMGKSETLAFRIIEHHYDDVLNNRIPVIAKSLSRSATEIRKTIELEIALLDLHPGTNQSEGHYRDIAQYITPDVIIIAREESFSIEINDERIPQIRFNPHYFTMLEDPNLPDETRGFIMEKISSGKWLMRNLHERHQTLYRIAEELIQSQKSFFSNANGKLKPITMKEIAQKLELHESTIARAVAGKYVSCPRGVLPLRSFFTHAYTTDEGETISAETVKELLHEILRSENRKRPLSDEAISSIIKAKGIPCARRTVAKYRQELGIGNTSQRRMY